MGSDACNFSSNPVQVGQFRRRFHVSHDNHFHEWKMAHFASEEMNERGQPWQNKHGFSAHSQMFSHLANHPHVVTTSQKEGDIFALKQTSLGLGTLFIPNINTTVAPVIISSQGSASHICPSLFGQHSEIPPPSPLVLPTPPQQKKEGLRGPRLKQLWARI